MCVGGVVNMCVGGCECESVCGECWWWLKTFV